MSYNLGCDSITASNIVTKNSKLCHLESDGKRSMEQSISSNMGSPRSSPQKYIDMIRIIKYLGPKTFRFISQRKLAYYYH